MTLGKDPNNVDAATPSTDEVAAALGFGELDDQDSTTSTATTFDAPVHDADDNDDDGADEDGDDAVPSRRALWAMIQRQQDTIEHQQEMIDSLEARVDDLERRADKDDEQRRELAQNATQATEAATEAKEIARSASAKACQVEADLRERDDDSPDDEAAHPSQLPGDVEPSTSPLDFFANCRQYKVKQRFVDDQNKQNTYRAILVATRWEEFATRRTDGSGIFFDRDDVRTALTAIMGEQPHGTTLNRVWTALKDLGSSDLEAKTRQVSAQQAPTQILTMDIETAKGLLEDRYCHLDLLDNGGVTAGGVTPVVTQPDAAEV